jgi:hypothetical protein
MSRRVIASVVVVLFTLAFANLLWAKAAPKPKGDCCRCARTCTTVMSFYSGKYAKMKAHEGDKQCWQTCSTLKGKSSASAQAMKAFWKQNMHTSMRANQCAQACWRSYHKGSSNVRVAGWKSAPRSATCASK